MIDAFDRAFPDDPPPKPGQPLPMLPDVMGAADVDRFAARVLNSLPQKAPVEFLSFIKRDRDGRLFHTPPVKGNEARASAPVDAAFMADVVAVVHTHHFDHQGESSAQENNRENKFRGSGDIDLVEQWGVPNYFRSPTGNAIRVVERLNGAYADPKDDRVVWRR